MEISTKDIITFVVASLLVGCVFGAPTAYDVTKFGAVGDGTTDDAEHFLSAWDAACNDSGSPTLTIPRGKTFLLSQIDFKGPCKSAIHVQILGNVVAPGNKWNPGDRSCWITFIYTNDLTIDGSGQIDGKGAAWWAPCNSNDGQGCKTAPDLFGVFNCNNFKLSGLHFINSPAKHVDLYHCVGVDVHNIAITAPEDSPNTDGMHVQESQNVFITNSKIASGDDCIAVGRGSSNVNITKITCGPGHGISIGSLGQKGSHDEVQQVHVSNCSFNGTTNGARIKTWQGGSGFAKGITFSKLQYTSVKNPIIIDQNYCPHQTCTGGGSSVDVRDVQYIGIHGTTADDVAITFNCSQSVGCTGIHVEDIDIQPSNAGLARLNEKLITSFCVNAHGTKTGVIVPDIPCLSS